MPPTRCLECGAELPAATMCLDLVHALLPEATNPELRRMHGLTVMTYYLQHPSLSQPGFRVWGRNAALRISGQGVEWQTVLLEGQSPQRRAATLGSRDRHAQGGRPGQHA